MSRKEDIETIRRILSERCRLGQGEGPKAGGVEMLARRRNLIRESGIMDLIDELGRKGLISRFGITEKDSDYSEVMVSFNYRDGGSYDWIRIRVQEEVLVISGKENYWVEGEMKMAEALGFALAEPRVCGEYHTSPQSWGV